MLTVVDAANKIKLQTGASRQLLGYAKDELCGSSFLELVKTADRPAAVDAIDAARAGKGQPRINLRMLRSDGSWARYECTASALGRTEEVAIDTRDVTEEANRRRSLYERAFRDHLTKLANRSLFSDRIEHALALGRARDSDSAVILLDIDDFARINNEAGHVVGDVALIEVARRLSEFVDTGATVARLEGDKFGLVLEQVTGEIEIKKVSTAILESCRGPLHDGGREIAINVSVGSALTAGEILAAEQLLLRAEVALHDAKEGGKNTFRIFDAGAHGAPVSTPPGGGSGPDASISGRHPGLTEIDDLMANPDRIKTVFQPILDLRANRVVGYEALSRISGAENRPPNVWFELAHEVGRGIELEALALRVSLFAAADRPDGCFVSVNLSSNALLSSDVNQIFTEMQDLTGVVVELTEGELSAGGSELAQALARLHEMGGRLALDEAGAVYSGLGELLELQPDIIKLDRSVIEGISSDAAKHASVESFVRFTQQLGASICAEGIEEVDDLLALARLDVTFGQGYCLGRPMDGWGGAASPALEAVGRSNSDAHQIWNVDDPTADPEIEQIAALAAGANQLDQAGGLLDSIRTTMGGDFVVLASLVATEEGVLAKSIATLGDGEDDDGCYPLEQRPFASEAVEAGRVAVVVADDPNADEGEVGLLSSAGYAAIVLIPVYSGGSAMGMLEIFSRQKQLFSRLDLARARHLAHLLGMRMELEAMRLEAERPLA